jgi:sigma-B regulation protein RsbU (phosphoserine phosphatase)
MILAGLLAVVLLHVRFWIPVTDLSRGLQAMTGKEFGHRLPEGGNDELGHLCRAFNQALGRLEEMELARGLQKMILPRQGLRLGDWEVEGRNEMMDAVGGDIYAYFPLPDGTCGLFLGDVSGHGLAASLVTVMAKVSLQILTRRWPGDPEQIFGRINRLFLDMLQKKKMMTAILALFDPRSGSLKIFNAGQCSPLVLRSSVPQFLSLPSQPLGVVKKPLQGRQTIVLGAEDSLVVYSDGVVESQDPQGRPVGFDEFARLVGESAAGIGMGGEGRGRRLIDDLFARLRRHLQGNSFQDDATVLVLTRTGRT